MASGDEERAGKWHLRVYQPSESKVVPMNYEVKIRVNGFVSYVNVTANSVSQAHQLIRAQYGNSATILGTTRK
ncbi:hypothetical protein N9F76_01500 [bacterium]|nr:hypothetical protein [bacterium]